MTGPTQHPASNSEARKRAEALRVGAVACICSEDAINAVGCSCGASLRASYLETYDPWGSAS
jgi:hypothetical protein